MSIFDTPATDTAPVGDNGGVAAPDPVVAGDPVDNGVAGGDGAANVEPVTNYLDVDQYGDHLVKVKIGGEEKELPFSKVRDGLMMQEAFTQKTQELAEEKRRLQQAAALVDALDMSPAETLAQLAEVYDLDPTSGFERIQRDPQEQQLRNTQRQLAQQQAALARERIEIELTTLQQQYGATEADIRAAAAYAKDKGLDLVTAYKATAFDNVRSQGQQTAATQARRQAAAAASQTVHDGAVTQRGAAGTQQSRPVTTVREAWLAAKKTHNLS